MIDVVIVRLVPHVIVVGTWEVGAYCECGWCI